MPDRNGYFQVIVKPDGTYLHLIPPTGMGERIALGEVTNYLSFKTIFFDLVELDRVIKLNEDTVIKLSAEQPFVEREMMILDFSEGDLQCTARFYPPFHGGECMDRTEILNDLKHNGVEFGIDEKVIDDFVENREYCKTFVIARGIPMKEGTDARIEYLFNTDLTQRPAQNEDGSVDYYNLDNICRCSAGDVLARMIPAVPGITGKTVRNKFIMPKIPRNVLFQFGKNIKKSDDGLQLISEISGHVTLTDDKVFVTGELDITNVDVSTGNIDYDGSVLVKGNVISGFTVKATGDIEVHGVVEGAHLIAGGQIIINRGINGMSHGVLEAGSNILCKYIENATVRAGGYVETDCIIHSTVSAGTHIVVQGKKGFITGGAARAGEYIDVKTIGSTMGVDTIVEVGVDPNLREHYNNLNKETARIRKDITRLEPVIRAVGERLGRGEKLAIDQMKEAKQLSKILAQNKEQLKSNMVEMAKLEIQFDNCSDAVIKVSGQAFPGTKLTVSGASLVLKTPYQYCRFIRDGADVIMKPL